MKNTQKILVVSCAISLSTLLAACGGHRASDTSSSFDDMVLTVPDGSKVVEENGERKVIHAATPADEAYLKETTPIASERATLYINGMGCPQCITSVDLALERTKGVEAIRMDLGTGVAYVKFAADAAKRPSPAQLHTLIADNGFTLVRIARK